MLKIRALIGDAKCYDTVRRLRRPDRVRCPDCDSAAVIKKGRDGSQPERRRHECSACRRRFDDLTGTISAGHHQPLRVRILCLHFRGLNLSDEQVARELDLNPDDAQRMTSRLREGIVRRKPEVRLSGEVECDEVYAVAGHEGHPEAVGKKGGRDAADARRGPPVGGRRRRRSRRSSG